MMIARGYAAAAIITHETVVDYLVTGPAINGNEIAIAFHFLYSNKLDNLVIFYYFVHGISIKY
jgi:hypothetical protein